MNDVSVESLKQSIEGLHDCKANFRDKVPVTETFEDEVVWDGMYLCLI